MGIVRILLFASISMVGVSLLACVGENVADMKADSRLLLQVELRRQQIADPSDERLTQMREMGMIIDDIGVQRIYIHLEHSPSEIQTDEIRSLGITLYNGSWVPPVGQNRTGFILADMPVEALESLAEKEYVIKLDTAENPGRLPIAD